MRHRDDAVLACDLMKKRISLDPARGLEAQPLFFCNRRNIDMRGMKRHAQFRAKVRNGLFVEVRFFSDAVIDMCAGKTDIRVFSIADIL